MSESVQVPYAELHFVSGTARTRVKLTDVKMKRGKLGEIRIRGQHEPSVDGVWGSWQAALNGEVVQVLYEFHEEDAAAVVFERKEDGTSVYGWQVPYHWTILDVNGLRRVEDGRVVFFQEGTRVLWGGDTLLVTCYPAGSRNPGFECCEQTP